MNASDTLAVGLRCIRCDADTPFDPRAYLCERCGAADRAPGAVVPEDPGILDVRYDYVRARRDWGARTAAGARGVFRYRALLPVSEGTSVLPAGDTALVPAPRLAAALGLRTLYLKDETRNPTRCLKDRATAVAVSLAQAVGARAVYCASAGNAAISLAGFSANAGLACHVFVPSYASPVRLAWLRRFAADVRVSTGDYDQAVDESEREGSAHDWYSRNCALNPFLVEGKKTVAFEIAEQLDGHAPDIVAAPVGDGCTLAAIGKGFRELREIGVTSALPRLLGAQAAAVQPIVRRYAAEHGSRTEVAGEPATAASSIAVRRPRNALRLLRELRESDGEMLAVTDAEIGRAQRRLAEEAGVVAEFTSAATLAALARLAEHEELGGKTAVLVITGGRLDDAA
ncbi:MAG: threonine synthase [Gemmatimonadaceae bacterium]